MRDLRPGNRVHRRGRDDLPNAHWRVSGELDEIRVDAPALGGEVSLEDAILAAVRRNA
jgi:hypothetical protein